MFIPFDTLADTSRLWIYQANRPLQSDELAQIQIYLTTQIDAWGAHGAPLKASFSMIKNQIIVVFLLLTFIIKMHRLIKNKS